MTVDKELFADTLPTYLTRFVGRDREIATVLRQYGEQSFRSWFDPRISNLGPALNTVVMPSSSVVT